MFGRNRRWSKIVVGLMLVFMLTACDLLPLEVDWSWLTGETEPAPVSTTPPTGELTPIAEAEVTPTPSGPPEDLTIWLPPDMDPQGSDQAARLLKAQLEAFEVENGIKIHTRVKNSEGPGGLLDALTATSAAAPSVLPDIIVLSRDDLETAALKSLVYSLDGKTTLIDEVDWFAYARELALIQGSIYGVPFTGDALSIIYRSDIVSPAPNTWFDLNTTTSEIAFAANDAQANVSLALYQAAGGSVRDNQNRPLLEVSPLTDVLNLYKQSVDIAAYRQLVLQLQNEEQAWLAYDNEQAQAAIVPVSIYLQQKPKNTDMITIPPVKDMTLTTGSGWVWALATPQPERQALSVALMETLSESAFLSAWNEAYGGMPPRPSALDAWQDAGIRSLISQISVMTILEPSSSITASLGPVIRDAVIQVLRDNVEPAVAAQKAVESVR
jgi:ABC-type glycerol-3-phosphate transport system substrate-binding protein